MGTVAAETTTGEAQLFERHSDLVYRYCLRMLGSREDAEDATQTTFIQALRALRRGVVPNFEQAWLLTIARNECKSRYRAGSRRRQRELAHDPQVLAEFAAAAPNGGDGRLIGVRAALERLPETQRNALLLREWQGRSYNEIARELGVSRPAVEALLFRARRGLARELGEETRERRHALDLASLLAAAKSFLGGGAAVKVAAGVAAVATVGVVAGSAQRGPAPLTPHRGSAPEIRPVADVTREAQVPVAQRVVSKQGSARVTPTSRGSTALKERSRGAAPAPGAASAQAPHADQPASPHPTPAHAPSAPVPAGTPSLPNIPSVPPAPPPPALPPLPIVGEVPLPQLPAVEVPAVPELPKVETPVQVPQVPDLPIVGDVPILP